jgi:nitroreductase
MDLSTVLRDRRSVRSFKDEPIPRPVLEEILTDAARAPSAINMQPWEVHVVLGEERKRLSRRLLRAFKERGIGCGPGATRILPDKFVARARECADLMTPLTESMGSDFKTYINEGSLDFYGAPAVALLFIDECFPAERMTDIGSFLAYLLLAATAHHVASCPIGLVTAYADEIKDQLNVPESKMLVISVALGLPASGAAVNEFRSPRAGLKEFVRWID